MPVDSSSLHAILKPKEEEEEDDDEENADNQLSLLSAIRVLYPKADQSQCKQTYLSTSVV